MKLLEALNLKGGRIEIPDCSRSDLPQLFVDLGFKAGAEIGVERGLFSEELARVGLTLHSIDPWLHCPAWPHQQGQRRMEQMYEDAKARLAPYENCTMIRKTSMEAVQDFADASLDFVYIDGNHEFRYVAEDLHEWPKKVRKGGIVSGHDYFTPIHRDKSICCVAPILHAYVGWFSVETWYVLGRKTRRPGEQRERHRSWFWVRV